MLLVRLVQTGPSQWNKTNMFNYNNTRCRVMTGMSSYESGVPFIHGQLLHITRALWLTPQHVCLWCCPQILYRSFKRCCWNISMEKRWMRLIERYSFPAEPWKAVASVYTTHTKNYSAGFTWSNSEKLEWFKFYLGRPIISNTNCPTENIPSFPDIFQTLVWSLPSYIIY